ncbi:hypothetical protein [Massilia sp. CCM 8734]|uniref:hypothetical protein n=1 Tax=Massilia sp. CCM 8734 TaxID=2609283 RepID=UPI00142133D5|nr:hypothetical protein [Massilia sp. CCM 8734]NHZ96332.1 hypothetical protein [Massilia sp. CCM 8734]
MRLMILLFVAAALALATMFLSGFASANFLQQLATLNPASKGLLTVSLLVSTAVLLLLSAWARNR